MQTKYLYMRMHRHMVPETGYLSPSEKPFNRIYRDACRDGHHRQALFHKGKDHRGDQPEEGGQRMTGGVEDGRNRHGRQHRKGYII